MSGPKIADPQLAQASWDLIVYSGKPSFVEANKALPPGSIHVRAPLEKDGFGAAVLGAAGGLITGPLCVAPQLIGVSRVLDTSDGPGVRRLVFVLPIGFVAGRTFDAVCTMLRGTDVSQAQTLAAMITVRDRGGSK
jgi:hypothetical protein